MRDIDPKPDEETPYECFQCGNIIIAEISPGQCPDCSGPIRNRQMPLE
jgi:rubrerythrin